MPLIIAENRNTEGDGYLLSGNDDIAVEAGITVQSTGASGIATWSGAHVFTINGTVRGYNDGISMLGTPETCTVIVSASGVIDAYGSADPARQSNGVLLDGIHSTLSNAGRINGAYGGLTTMVNGAVVVVNSGTISGGVYGINAPFGLGSLELTNSGTVSGPTAILGAAGVDTITNTGTITGVINLREGHDILHNTGRITAGLIDLGLGNDRFTDAATSVINNDSVLGNEGSDTISGGLGDDTLRGGTWHDLLSGGAGNDLLDGGAGADTLQGDDGDDRIYGGDGNDTMLGGAGNDLLEGMTGRDTLSGGAGADTLRGGDDADRLDGGSEGDLLEGGRGSDTILGETGNDTLRGGADGDVLYGGDGDDVFQEGGPASGNDRMRGGAGNDRFTAGAGQDTLFGEDGDDLLKGNFGDDQLYGGDGADVLRGGAGADILQGGQGIDRLNGGSGADQFVFARPSDGRDFIQDFRASEDRLVFEGSAFGYGNQTGRISLDDCVFDRAQEANDHWVYVRATKTLFFDANGNEAGGRVAIATFTDANGMEGWNLWLI
ncbi:MAG TPA: calcium-binding protein [Gemmobacter sp.]|nr:calcium-binding protein [Gemmobacter sp.]